MNRYLYIILGFTLLLFSCKTDDENEASPPAALSNFEKTFGGAEEDIANSLVQLGNAIYIYGHTSSFGELNGDHYLIKTDLAGNLIWEKTYGDLGKEEGTEIVKAKDGNLFLLGTTDSKGAGLSDIHVLKITPDGELIWEKTFGGSSKDFPASLIETSRNEICIAATTESFGAGSRDMYVIWLDQNGQFIREKVHGGTDIDGSEGLVELDNKQLALFGYTANYGATDRDYYLLKMNLTGDSLWSSRYGSSRYEESYSLSKTPNGGLLMNGHSANVDPNHNMYAVNIDSNGIVLWEKHFGGSEHDGGQASLVNKEGNYVLLGRGLSFGDRERNIFMVITDPDGNQLSETIIGKQKDERADKIIEVGSYYYIAGHSNSFSSNGDNDAYLVRLKK
ncbi:MAG: hypothetical protein JKY48_10965 [Flavobacteriales bacterium]|nr:hypothetical protein [Flavobacteriales bacterium]